MATVGPIVVTVCVDTREAEKRLRLLRLCLWLNGLWPRLRCWLCGLVPASRRRLCRVTLERNQARAIAADLHQRYWDLLAVRNLDKLSGKN
ncbi:MAG TPA: hypothetical protein PK280_17390 [Planctomycetota bacterium]|nr:hypothetical protein [Planctomycetota bacterium]